MKSMKKALAAALSAAMVMGMSVPAMAEDNVEVEAPIFSLDVLQVVVPTTYAVAFNPEGLTVQMKADAGSPTSTDQILSRNYGIVNKSSKDKVITVALKVENQNNDKEIVFVDTEQDVIDAQEGEYKIHLAAIPADTSEVQVGGASADKDTAAAALGDVTMATSSNAVALKAGDNKIGFKLEKAAYTPDPSKPLILGATSNNAEKNFKLTSLAPGGKGITAFTFGGEMNANADWSSVKKGIKITAVYTNETATSDVDVIDETGAMVALTSAPTFASSEVGKITYTTGSGDNALKSVTKVEMAMPDGTTFNGYAANGKAWSAATDENGIITLSASYLKYYQDSFTGDTTREATITYTTEKDEVKTAKVDVKLR